MPKPAGVALQVGDDLVARHEAVGVVAVVGAAGELHRPVRRHQAEAVPAPAPGLADATLLEDDVGDARLRKQAADREAGLTPADNDDRGIVNHPIAEPIPSPALEIAGIG